MNNGGQVGNDIDIAADLQDLPARLLALYGNTIPR